MVNFRWFTHRTNLIPPSPACQYCTSGNPIRDRVLVTLSGINNAGCTTCNNINKSFLLDPHPTIAFRS